MKFTGISRKPDTTPLNHCGPNHKSPLSHCGSSMMHSEGWNKMRTHNSPNTIGNEAAFRRNEKLRSPLNTGENHLWNGPLSRVAKTTKGKGRNFRSTEEGAGMTEKGVKAYKKENPGSKLQTAVTEKNPTGKRASRRKSFCARSRGWKGERGRAARARWNC
jgi:hypothetical protein|tara:strand:+ start:1132 stop:1614 length:483 start_codon:yes stop_codon:yes gene_type:complete